MKIVDGLIKWLLGMNNADIVSPSKSKPILKAVLAPFFHIIFTIPYN